MSGVNPASIDVGDFISHDEVICSYKQLNLIGVRRLDARWSASRAKPNQHPDVHVVIRAWPLITPLRLQFNPRHVGTVDLVCHCGRKDEQRAC